MTKARESKFLVRQNPWYQAATGSVIVSSVFTVFVLVMLLFHLYQYKVTDPRRADQFGAMKQAYQQRPADKSLEQEIRAFDLKLRRDQLARLQFLRRGVLLLVVCAAVLFAALMWQRSFLPDEVEVSPPPDAAAEQVHQAFWARGAVTGVLILLGAAGLYVSLKPPVSEVPVAEPTVNETQEQDVVPVPAAEPKPAFASMEQMRQNWPVFRGFGGLGVCPFEDIPTEWDGASGKNILWKTAVPLEGRNSPIVWGEKIFLTGATAEQQQVYCFDANTGTLLWTRDVPISPSPERADMELMEDTGYSAPTAATNGVYVAAIFADGQVGCFDFDGHEQWIKPLGIPESAYGYASSLTVFESSLIIQLDQGWDPDKSKLIALDFETGAFQWQTDRPVPNSWTSPTVVSIADAWQILTSGSPWVIGYDAKAGSELWRADCLSGDVAPTQVTAGGKVFAVEPYSKMVAIDAADASGDVTESGIAWETDGDMPDICSPVCNETYVWVLTTQGTLGCYAVSDGREVYDADLDGMFQASPSLVGDSLYVLSEKGKMLRISAGAEFEILGDNELGEATYASPAFMPGRIYLRGTEHLTCIGISN